MLVLFVLMKVDLYVQEDTTANATIFTLFEPTLIEIFCSEFSSQ